MYKASSTLLSTGRPKPNGSLDRQKLKTAVVFTWATATKNVTLGGRFHTSLWTPLLLAAVISQWEVRNLPAGVVLAILCPGLQTNIFDHSVRAQVLRHAQLWSRGGFESA